MDDKRFCNEDEVWVCAACGRHVEKDNYNFTDVSCMLNSFKAKKEDCVYKDDDPTKQVVEIRRHEDG